MCARAGSGPAQAHRSRTQFAAGPATPGRIHRGDGSARRRQFVLEAADIIVNRRQRKDIGFTLIGSGDCFDELIEIRDGSTSSEFVEFTGRVPDEAVAAILSSADVGISPDPKNPLNDLSTMNKTMEYMAFGLPVAAFDLRETRASAAEAGVYADAE